jgi:hypothetical protein
MRHFLTVLKSMRPTTLTIACLALAGLAQADVTLNDDLLSGVTPTTNSNNVTTYTLSGEGGSTAESNSYTITTILSTEKAVTNWSSGSAGYNAAFIGTTNSNGYMVCVSSKGNSIVGNTKFESSGTYAFTTITDSNTSSINWTDITTIDWSNVSGAALTLTVSTTNTTESNPIPKGSTIYLTLLMNSGIVTTYAGNNSSLCWTGGTLTSLQIQSSFVTSTYLFSEAVTENNAIALNHAALNIPEPSSATLSLLALSGLAIRRRRKMA